MNSRNGLSAVAALVAMVGTASTSVDAKEQLLKFRLVTHSLETNAIPASNAEGHLLGVGKFRGVAIFDDGRLADKSFTVSFDYTKGIGPYHGYSIYTFEDGSTIVARFDGNAKAGPDGRRSRGEYSDLIGIGTFEGVQGGGWFESRSSPWEQGASLFDGEFALTLP